MTVRELRSLAGGSEAGQRPAPVVVLSYTGSGADALLPALSATGELACTSGTGIVPLCHQAMASWQAVDGSATGQLSPLAAASARALCSGLMRVILARDGRRRWCEFCAAPPAAARSFLRLYPQARFLIVHRRAESVIRSILDDSRWGLAGPEFAPFVAAYPASTVSALASYWATRAASLIEFEQAHGASCHRIRIEDLTTGLAAAERDIGEFLGLNMPMIEPDRVRQPDTKGLPLAEIPPPQLARLDELHELLGYQPGGPLAG
jgi:hypothetical protein